MTATIHQFDQSRRQGEQHAEDPMWERAYRGFFGPLYVGMMRSGAGNVAQFRGIDRWIHLSDGRTLRVDEKRREKDYGDVLLEVWSSKEDVWPGWIKKDLEIDFLAYAVVPSRKVYLFSWPTLRRAWVQHGARWQALAKADRQGFRVIHALNRRPNGTEYTTTSIAVPMAELLAAYGTACVVDVSAGAA